MWLSVFIVFSLVVFVWASSFQQKLVFLLDDTREEKTLAASNESPLALIGGSFSDLKSLMLGLFGLATGTRPNSAVIDEIEDKYGIKVEPRLLPLSEDREQ